MGHNHHATEVNYYTMKSIILITMLALALARPNVPNEPEAGKVFTGSVDSQEAVAEATIRLLALQEYVRHLQANPGLTRSATGQRATNNSLASVPILGQLLDILLSLLNGSLLDSGAEDKAQARLTLSNMPGVD